MTHALKISRTKKYVRGERSFMEPIETKIIIDKITFRKIKKYIVTPFVKKAHLFAFITLACLFIIAIVNNNASMRDVILGIIPALLFNRFFAHVYFKTTILSMELNRKRKMNNITCEKFEFITILNDDYFEIKDAIEYKDNTILKTEYNYFRWLIESETYYVLLPKTWVGMYGWGTRFGLIKRSTINESGRKAEFLDFINSKCPKLKMVLMRSSSN